MQYKWIIPFLIGLSWLGCKSQAEPKALFDATLVSPDILSFHGEDRLAVLLYPDVVHSYRVEKVAKTMSSSDSKRGRDYRIVTQGPDLSHDQIDHLRRLYIDMRGYNTLRRKELRRYFPFEGIELWGSGCEWNPDIVLAYERDGGQVCVVICFGCSMWAFESEGKRYGAEGFAEDTRASGLQPMLRSTVIELFPEMINYIPEHRY